MKKILFSVIAFAITLVAVVSCDSDEFTEADALKNQKDLLAFQDSLRKDSILLADSLARIGAGDQELRDSLLLFGKIDYSIKVFNASENGVGSAKSANDAGLEGVNVSIAQYGFRLTETTDATGMVIFSNLRVGTANITISADGYTDVAFVADITPDMNESDYSDVDLYHMSSAIAVFSTTENLATIKGKITAELDLTNDMPEPVSEINLLASIDVSNAAFGPYIIGSTNDYYASIEAISYASVMKVTESDNTGMYEIQVPSTPDGLPYNVKVTDYVADQKLLLNTRYGKDVNYGVNEVRTLFGSSIDAAAASGIPTVSPVFVELADPSGSADRRPTTATDAQAVAVVTKSGVEAIHITNPGENYTQAPNVVITSTNPLAEPATAVATLLNGRVNDIQVGAEGLGYTASNVGVSLTESIERQASLEAVVTAELEMIEVTNPGYGYLTAPAVSIEGDGNGATAVAELAQVVDEYIVTSAGNGYTQTPEVLIEGGNPSTYARATATLTGYGPILDVETNNAYYYSSGTNLAVNFESRLNGGNGATASAALDLNNGQIANLQISTTTPGQGYTEFPTLVVDGNAKAEVIALGAGGSITGVSITYEGSGYAQTSIPNIQVIGSAFDINNNNITETAIITAELAFPMEVTVNLTGSDYEVGSTSLMLTTGGTTTDITADYSPVISQGIASVDVFTDISGAYRGYDFATPPTVNIIRKGDDAGTDATVDVVLTNVVDKVTVTNPGEGYVYGNTRVYIDAAPDGGTDAVVSIPAGGLVGRISSINILDGGKGYTAVPNYILSDVSEDSTATLTLGVSGGMVSSATVNYGGKGYASAPAISISTFTSGATAKAQTNPEAGKIEAINVTLAGTDYLRAPIVEIADLNGVASDAAATAIVENGGVTNVDIDNGGTGYFKAPAIKFVYPNYITKATAYATVNEMGVITAISVDETGMGYLESDNSVTITPQIPTAGSGASAIAVISNGMVSRIDLIDGGKDYLSQNTPGNFGGNAADVGTDANGSGFTKYNYNTNTDGDYIVKSNDIYIVDYFLGTGQRIEEY